MSCTTSEKDPKTSSFHSKESQSCQEKITKKKNLLKGKKQLTRVEKLKMFLGNFDISKYWIRVILLFSVHENETGMEKCTPQKSYDRLISLCSKLITKSVKTLLPGPGFPKFKISSLVSTLYDWSNKSKKRFIERSVLYGSRI